jgi:hypothetical protein
MSRRNGSEWWQQLPDRLEGFAVIGVSVGVVVLVGWILLGAL